MPSTTSVLRRTLRRGTPQRMWSFSLRSTLAFLFLISFPLAMCEGHFLNVALNKPCTPRPACSNLVDGNIQDAPSQTRPSRLRGHRRYTANSAASGSASDNDTNATVMSVPGNQDIAPFKVYLGEPAFVTHVIVRSNLVQGGNTSAGGSRWRKLVVTWAEEDNSEADSVSNRINEDTTILRYQSSARNEMVVLSADPSLHLPHTSLSNVVKIGHKASNIAVTWGDIVRDDSSLPGVCNSLTSQCDELQVTEVEIMSQTFTNGAASDNLQEESDEEESDVFEESAAVPATWINDRGKSIGNLYTTTIQFHSQTGEQLADSKDERQVAPTRKQRASGNPSAARSTSAPTTLAPENIGLDSSSNSNNAKDTPNYEGQSHGPSWHHTDAHLEEVVTDYYTADVDLSSGSGRYQESSSSSLSTRAATKLSPACGLPAILLLGSLVAFAIWRPQLPCLTSKDSSKSYELVPGNDGTVPAGPSISSGLLGTPALSSTSPLTSGLRLEGGDSVSTSETEPEMEPEDNCLLRLSSHFQGPAPAQQQHRHQQEVLNSEAASQPALTGSPRAELEAVEQVPPPRSSSTREGGNDSGRFQMLFASPLCHIDAQQRPVPMVPLPFDKEWATLLQAYNEAAASLKESDPLTLGVPHRLGGARPRQPSVSLSARTLTMSSLQRALAPATKGAGSPTVLHLSAHGTRDCLVLEDAERPLTAHLLSCETLRDLLSLRGTRDRIGGVQLVFLHACGAMKLGQEFVNAGVPHVVCSSTTLQDSVGQAFLRVFYHHLFQGSLVSEAFASALVSLRGDADAAVRAMASQFCLLPQGESCHDVALFEPLVWPTMAESRPQQAMMRDIRAQSFHDTPTLQRVSWRKRLGDGGNHSSSTSHSHARNTDETPFPQPPEESDGVSDKAEDNREETDGDAGSSGEGNSSRPSSLLATCRRARTSRRRREFLFLRGGYQQQQRVLRRSLPGPGFSPFLQPVPTLPEDFCGRSVDVWQILQSLGRRRAVVVCSQEGLAPGIGKSAVVDAVHRAFALQAGGLCVGVKLSSPPSQGNAADLFGTWIREIHSSVRRTIHECRQLHPLKYGQPSRSTSCCGCNASRGFKPLLPLEGLRQVTCRGRRGSCDSNFSQAALSNPNTSSVANTLAELRADLAELATLSAERRREWPAASDRILLLIDGCDHLIQQQHFQEAIVDLLQSSTSYRVVLSTHQRMLGIAGGRFKVVQHALGRLSRRDSAKLLLLRVQRPLRWEELLVDRPHRKHDFPSALRVAMDRVGASDGSQNLTLSRSNETEVFEALANHPVVAEQHGNPRKLIELAAQVNPDLSRLSDMMPEPKVEEEATSIPPAFELSSRRTSPAFASSSNLPVPTSIIGPAASPSQPQEEGDDHEREPLLDRYPH